MVDSLATPLPREKSGAMSGTGKNLRYLPFTYVYIYIIIYTRIYIHHIYIYNIFNIIHTQDLWKGDLLRDIPPISIVLYGTNVPPVDRPPAIR